MSDRLFDHYIKGFRSACESRTSTDIRIGAELKFPLVQPDGSVAPRDACDALWHHLYTHDWAPLHDDADGIPIGGRKLGAHNDSLASCETGYCKPEFSLAHVGSLNELADAVDDIRAIARSFREEYNTHLIAYGIQPVTSPSRDLLMKKSRSSLFDHLFVSHNVIPEERGHDLHLFTVNACSHVHVSVTPENAVRAVNILNGFAPAQIFLTGNSSVWSNRVDPTYCCVNERFWDWWIDDTSRIGIPPRPFTDIHDYLSTICALKPVFVRRDGIPYRIDHYSSFLDYFTHDSPHGYDLEGTRHALAPTVDDLDYHSTCYWYSARLTRYFTVENRANDQQPPDALCAIAALTLGLLCAAEEAQEELNSMSWDTIRAAREPACRLDPGSEWREFLTTSARRMLAIALLGLTRRGHGEEHFLAPLQKRAAEEHVRAPGHAAADLFTQSTPDTFVTTYSL